MTSSPLLVIRRRSRRRCRSSASPHRGAALPLIYVVRSVLVPLLRVLLVAHDYGGAGTNDSGGGGPDVSDDCFTLESFTGGCD